MVRFVSFALALLASAGCGTSTPSAGSGGSAGIPSTAATAGVGGGGGFDASSGAGGASGCSEAAELVYVLTLDNDLYSFAPASLTLTKIGALDCITESTPYDMAVARDARAYVVMIDGSLFSVDTATAHCTPTDYVYDESGYGFGGLAFVTETGDAETLYTSTRERAIDGGGCSCGTMTDDNGVVTCFPLGKGLAGVDLPALELAPLGDYSSGLDQQSLSLTGTGDGRLFGYFNGYPIKCGGSTPPSGPQIVAIDTKTAATPDPIPVTNVLVGQDSTWAFTFWGGDFWLYSSNGGNSQITRHRYSGDGSFTVVVPDTGMRIVGAGVSTCAPLESPE